ncbi:TetR family transcriptional regulator [Marmoricola endophyticus]|uniref:TetR family transcriptional regulator n=1 Tax=Marmoricola endophyticus TaxID=2040280 RepID=A0A917BDG8_9ACTN|nr:TetR/AcrR family transcriptional regulator [Marmoricola endophyticus]GGF36264.1 TetR family transcriptional regulator [Marmoricola endophyticus]
MATSADRRVDGRQSRWDRHNAERRQHLIDAAVAEIEASPPGSEIHVHQIAARAGVGRTVVYRHFDDRADLDRAVTAEIVDGLAERLVAEVTLDGTIPDIVRRVVGSYVEWASGHPPLHMLVIQGSGAGGSPLEEGMGRIAGQVHELLGYAIEVLGLDASDDELAALDSLAYGLVGAVFGAVRRWSGSDPESRPAPDVLVGLVADSVWFLISGHAAHLGLVLDRDQPVEEVLLGALSEPTP